MGLTTTSFAKRKWQHYKSIRNRRHQKKTLFACALRKNPKEDFDWRIIAHTDDKEQLKVLEKFYIRRIPKDRTLNMKLV